MKLLTSSSSSASSTITTTTTTSFDANVHNSRNTPASCIAGVLRRLLCLNNLPAHPSDHYYKDTDRDSVSVELDKLQCAKAEERVEASAAPSIVARLMGLESFPQIDFSTPQKSPNSISRSLSMNSVDLMKELVSIQGRHRRAKSFREIPAFLELQDDDFFILSFENGDENGKLRAKSRKSEMGSGQKQMKQSIKGESCNSKNNKRRESVYEKNKENLDTKTVSNENPERAINTRKVSQRLIRDDAKLKDSSNIIRPTNSSCRNSLVGKEVVKLAKPINHKPETELLGRRRLKKRKDDCLPVMKIETESNSENSSPNSVLDIMKFPGDPEVTSAEELSRLTNSKSRRTLTEDLENYRKLDHQSNDNGCISNAFCKSKSSQGRNVELRKYDHGSRHYVQTWGEICKLAGRETIQSNWIHSKKIQKFEEYKEISGEFEMQILDELFEELVAQLVGN